MYKNRPEEIFALWRIPPFYYTELVSSMGRADLLWPRVDLDLTRKVRSNTGQVNVDQWWARLDAGRGGDSFDPL